MNRMNAPASRLPARSSERELKRMRAYESLMVFVVVIAAALVVGGTAAVAVSSTLGSVSRMLGATP